MELQEVIEKLLERKLDDAELGKMVDELGRLLGTIYVKEAYELLSDEQKQQLEAVAAEGPEKTFDYLNSVVPEQDSERIMDQNIKPLLLDYYNNVLQAQ